MVIGVAFGLMSAFFMAGLYVAGALGVMSLIIMKFFSDAPLWNVMSNKAWEANTSFILTAIPLFILMGELMVRSGIAELMFRALTRWLFWIPGGLIHTNIMSCAIFAACSGSSAATAATISRVSLPSFRARGYNDRLVLGSLAAGGTLGILIPPSISFIIYGVLVEESIGRLYLAGFMPGFLLAGVFMVMIAIVSMISKGVAPREQGSLWNLEQWGLRFFGLVTMIPVFLIIFVVLGTIYLGIATPTEAAAFGVTGAFILAVINNSWSVIGAALRGTANKQQVDVALQENLKMLKDATLSTARTTGMIFLIVLAAFTLSFAFARLGVSQSLALWVTGFGLSPLALLAALVVFYLILGTFMESFAMLVTTIPILVPILIASKIDLVWFGVIMVILVEAALISPPEGINLYVLHGIRQDVAREGAQAEGGQATTGTIGDVWIGVLPFMLCMAIVIALIMAFPQIALWLPNLVKGK